MRVSDLERSSYLRFDIFLPFGVFSFFLFLSIFPFFANEKPLDNCSNVPSQRPLRSHEFASCLTLSTKRKQFINVVYRGVSQGLAWRSWTSRKTLCSRCRLALWRIFNIYLYWTWTATRSKTSTKRLSKGSTPSRFFPCTRTRSPT